MKYFVRVSHDPWRSGLNAWLRSSVCVLYSVASMLQDFIASNNNKLYDMMRYYQQSSIIITTDA